MSCLESQASLPSLPLSKQYNKLLFSVYQPLQFHFVKSTYNSKILLIYMQNVSCLTGKSIFMVCQLDFPSKQEVHFILLLRKMVWMFFFLYTSKSIQFYYFVQGDSKEAPNRSQNVYLKVFIHISFEFLQCSHTL